MQCSDRKQSPAQLLVITQWNEKHDAFTKALGLKVSPAFTEQDHIYTVTSWVKGLCLPHSKKAQDVIPQFFIGLCLWSKSHWLTKEAEQWTGLQIKPPRGVFTLPLPSHPTQELHLTAACGQEYDLNACRLELQTPKQQAADRNHWGVLQCEQKHWAAHKSIGNHRTGCKSFMQCGHSRLMK